MLKKGAHDDSSKRVRVLRARARERAREKGKRAKQREGGAGDLSTEAVLRPPRSELLSLCVSPKAFKNKAKVPYSVLLSILYTTSYRQNER